MERSEPVSVVVLTGSVRYTGNEESIVVNQGEGIFINSNVMHMSSLLLTQDTKMCSVLFDPSYAEQCESNGHRKQICTAGAQMFSADICFLSLDVSWHLQILICLRRILDLEEDKDYGYELEIRNCLGKLWLLLCRTVKNFWTRGEALPRLMKNALKNAEIHT